MDNLIQVYNDDEIWCEQGQPFNHMIQEAIQDLFTEEIMPNPNSAPVKCHSIAMYDYQVCTCGFFYFRIVPSGIRMN